MRPVQHGFDQASVLMTLTHRKVSFIAQSNFNRKSTTSFFFDNRAAENG